MKKSGKTRIVLMGSFRPNKKWFVEGIISRIYALKDGKATNLLEEDLKYLIPKWPGLSRTDRSFAVIALSKKYKLNQATIYRELFELATQSQSACGMEAAK